MELRDQMMHPCPSNAWMAYVCLSAWWLVGCWLLAVGCWLLACAACRLVGMLAVGCWLLAVGLCCLSACRHVGCWLLACAACWLVGMLAVGCWLVLLVGLSACWLLAVGLCCLSAVGLSAAGACRCYCWHAISRTETIRGMPPLHAAECRHCHRCWYWCCCSRCPAAGPCDPPWKEAAGAGGHKRLCGTPCCITAEWKLLRRHAAGTCLAPVDMRSTASAVMHAHIARAC
jgi:hypothetical protein